MAEAEPTYEVSNLRKWLVDVEKRIGLIYWDLLKLSYFDDFPFGTLERLQDQAELYNRLASSHTFSATESFQLLLRRLALLGRDGQSCIELLRDPKYQLSQPESSPELEQKLSRGSQLMEAIVAALVVLSPEQRRRLLIRLGGRQLHWHRDFCTLFRVISQLRHRLIITTESTEVFVEALQYVRAPRTAVERLVLYHNRYNLDLERFDFWAQQPVTDPWDTPRPASLPTLTIRATNESQPSSEPLGSAHRSRSLPGLTVVTDETTPLLPPQPQPHDELPPQEPQPNQRRSIEKYGCLSLIVFIVAIILAGSATLATYYGAYNHRKHAVTTAYANSQRTILLENVTGLLTDSVNITQTQQSESRTIMTTYYIASTSELDRTTEWGQEIVLHGGWPHRKLKAVQFMDPGLPALLGNKLNPFYFFPGDGMRYDVCLNTTTYDLPIFAYVAAFDREDFYNNFSATPIAVVANATAAWRNVMYIGTDKSECYNFSFTSPRHGFYYFSGFIDSAVHNDTDQYVSYNFTLTNFYRIFNLDGSAFTKLCPHTNSQKPCSHELKFDFSSSYSILGQILTSFLQDDENQLQVNYHVSYGFRWAFVGVMIAVIVVLAIGITSVLLCVGFGVCGRCKKLFRRN